MKTIFCFISICISCYAEAQTLFRWPLQAVNDYTYIPECYVTNNYVDQNTGAGIQDYNCGSRTYNGHLGVDIDLWPFTWSMMDNNNVAVVAAASGRVVAVDVGQNNENNCGGPPYANPTWNYIAIRHADSSTSFYGHIRNNSATVVVGDRVAEGQIIAFVGSSGSSSNPHLHFEVNSNAVTNSPGTGTYTGVIDPYYTGGCNVLNNVSWWQLQKPYREPAIIRVMTHFTQPRLTGFGSNNDLCRTGEAKNGKASFAANDSIYFGVAMRDFIQSASHSFNIRVFRPDGSEWINQNQASAQGDAFRKVYYTFPNRLPANAAAGTYRVQVSFNGTIASYFFVVNCGATQNIPASLSGDAGYKLNDAIINASFIFSAARVLYQSATKITLTDGFKASNGSQFRARIRDCNYVE